jgi:hypothetical protein
MDLISSSFGAASSIPGDKNAVIQSLFTAALETLSLLNVADQQKEKPIQCLNGLVLVGTI